MNKVSPKIVSVFRTEKFWLLLILLLSAIFRFWEYGSFSYSNDELSAIARAQFPSFSDLVSKGFYVDGHPGGIQVFLWLWIQWFGLTEWIVRFPFVLMGIASVWMTYKVTNLMFGKVSGLFSAATIGFLQFPLLYSQIARPYGPGMLFGLMLVYFWVLIFIKPSDKSSKPSILHLVGFTISAALCMYTHYFSFLFALIVGLSGFFVCKRSNCIPYIVAAIVAALLFVPHIYITLNHLTYKGLSNWLEAPSLTWFFGHLYYIFDESIFTILIVLGVVASLFFSSARYGGAAKPRLMLMVWFILPILVGYFYSLKVSPVLQHPVLIFSFPYLIILLFSFYNIEFTHQRKWILAIYLIIGFSGTVLVNKYYSKQHFGEFKQVAIKTQEWCNNYGLHSITKVASVNSSYYLDFYFKDKNKPIVFDQYEINSQEDLTKLASLVSKSSTPYFLLAITKPSPNEAEDIIRASYPYIVDYVDYGGMASVALYGKIAGKTFAQNYLLQERESYQVQPSLMKDSLSVANAEEAWYVIDSINEYSQGLDTLLNETINIAAIQVESRLLTFTVPNEIVLVVSVEETKTKYLMWRGAESSKFETLGKKSTIICTCYPESKIPAGSRLKVYFWNKKKKRVVAGDIKITIFTKLKNE